MSSSFEWRTPDAVTSLDAADDVDEQYCKMKFGSWTFSARQVTLEWYEDYRQVVDSIPSTYLLISHFFGVI